MWSVQMSSIYSVRNVFEKDNRGQVVVIVAGVVIVILIVILVILLVGDKSEDDNIQSNNNVEVTQDEIPVSTEYNKDHEYTLNDYLPWTNYDYLEDGSGVDVKYDITENTAISTIPVDLDEYEISYIVKECNK